MKRSRKTQFFSNTCSSHSVTTTTTPTTRGGKDGGKEGKKPEEGGGEDGGKHPLQLQQVRHPTLLYNGFLWNRRAQQNRGGTDVLTP
jgi:hypothetical protein